MNISNELAPWLGLDIGGANLKAAHTCGWTNHSMFPMWKQHSSLGVSIARMLDQCPPFLGVAVTMTGELADCFATRAEGVARILEQVTTVLPCSMVRVYSVDGQWLSVPIAARNPWSVAASNWKGLAQYACRLVGPEPSLLVDIGSTTTDIVPLCEQNVRLDALTDSQRLVCGSLVYTGVERSNVAGILNRVPLHGDTCPIMNEQFATARDAYLWLGMQQDDASDTNTADGKPATREFSRYRLARTVGEDGSILADADLELIAQAVFCAQTSLVANGMRLVLESTCWKNKPSRRSKQQDKSSLMDVQKIHTVLFSGQGDFLIRSALKSLNWDGVCIYLSDSLGTEISRCAPAFAIATLASEQLCPHKETSCENTL